MSEAKRYDPKHPRPCLKCKRETYRKSQVCARCDPAAVAKKCGRPVHQPEPKFWPEDYLLRCAEELLKRHNARSELLLKLGIKAEAA